MSDANWELLLERCREQSHAVLLVSNQYSDAHGRFELMYGEGVNRAFLTPSELNDFRGLAFGHIGYHYKNRTFQHLHSQTIEDPSWPAFYFFEPIRYRLERRDGRVETNMELPLRGGFPREKENLPVLNWHATETPESYLEKIE